MRQEPTCSNKPPLHTAPGRSRCLSGIHPHSLGKPHHLLSFLCHFFYDFGEALPPAINPSVVDERLGEVAVPLDAAHFNGNAEVPAHAPAKAPETKAEELVVDPRSPRRRLPSRILRSLRSSAGPHLRLSRLFKAPTALPKQWTSAVIPLKILADEMKAYPSKFNVKTA